MDINITDILKEYKDKLSDSEHNNIILNAQLSAAKRENDELQSEIDELKEKLNKNSENVSE